VEQEPSPRGDLVALREWEQASTSVEVQWPEPLTVVERLQRSLTFWRAILPVILSYLFLEATARFSPPAQRELLWEAAHEAGSKTVAATISSLRGFYSKSAQLIGSRPDLFPEQYTTLLAPFQDSAPPMDASLVIAVVEQELGRALPELFTEFDAEPLGSASVAQVHRARLRSNGQVVAVKVQRPAVEPLMLGDIANLLVLTRQIRGLLPVDYFVVFSELATQLKNEFDFTVEARSATRVADLLDAVPGGPPLIVPRPIAGLVSKRCLVMEFVSGTALSKLAERAAAGDPSVGLASTAARQLLGRQLLRALTDAYCVMLLQDGFLHADPHPGNLMITEDGQVALIDFGQCKLIPEALRKQLAVIMLRLKEYGDARKAQQSDLAATALAALGQTALAIGVTFRTDCADVPTTAAALAMWLFDSTAAQTLPGGYDSNELSSTSPVAQVASFPQSLVFVGRATVLIRGLATRLEVDWSLADNWAPSAYALLYPSAQAAAAARASVQRGWLQRLGGSVVRMMLRASQRLAAWLAWLSAVVGRGSGAAGVRSTSQIAAA